jgi:hypothetical protein
MEAATYRAGWRGLLATLAITAAGSAMAQWNADSFGRYADLQTDPKVMAALASPLADPEFKRAYYRALGPKVRETWLARLDGPSPGQKSVLVAEADYIEIAFCKAHDCHDNNVVLLFSRASGTVYGLVFEAGRRSTLIGQPPPAVAAELQRLWQSEWRPGR